MNATLAQRTKAFALRVIRVYTAWLELLIEAELVAAKRLEPLLAEADELISILVSSVLTIKRKRPR